MNLQKLLDANGPGPEFDYEKEIVERLETVLGSWLSLRECFALMAILAYGSFEFDDGFVMSDAYDVNKIIGLADAGAIVSCFREEPEYHWLWFKVRLPAYDQESEEYQSTQNDLLAKILTLSHKIE
jgi:hypothetical protein